MALKDSPQGSAMVSEDGDALAIFITLEPGVATSMESRDLARDIESIAFQEKVPGEEIYVIGEVYLLSLIHISPGLVENERRSHVSSRY